MILKRKSRTYSDLPEGVSYYSSQVLTNYALNPLDKTIDYIDNTKLGKLKPIKKQTTRFASVIKPLKWALKRNKNNHDHTKN